MLHYFKKAIELAQASEGTMVWATPRKTLVLDGFAQNEAEAFVSLNGILFSAMVFDNTVVIYHVRNSGSQRLASFERSGDSINDAHRIAILIEASARNC